MTNSKTLKSRLLSLAWKVGLLAMVGLGLFAFQNCTQMTEGTEDANSVLSDKMEFAYDTTIDQIAYMSCPAVLTKEKKPVDNMYFTIRAGAYRMGGVMLTDSFYKTYNMKTPERLADLLLNSKANSKTVMQLAVRQTGALNSMVTSPGSKTQNADFANMFVSFDRNEVFTNLISVGLDSKTNKPTEKRTRYLRDGTGFGAHVEGSLNFGSTEGMMDDLRRQYFASQAVSLALTYLEPGTSSGSAGNSVPDTDVRNQGTIFPDQYGNNPGLAYGTGFDLTFSQPDVNGGVPKGLPTYNTASPPAIIGESRPYPSNQLTAIRERNLLTGQYVPGKTHNSKWNCPPELRFKIIRAGDQNDQDPNAATGVKLCPRIPDRDVKTDFNFAIARNVLHVEDWYINMDKGCIVQKKDALSCYGDPAKIHYVQYNLSDPTGCDPNSNESSNGATSKICLAWVSICYFDPSL